MPEGYTMDEAKAAITGVASSFEQYKKANDLAIIEAKAGTTSAETKAKLEKIEADIQKFQQVKERLDQIEAFTKRKGPSSVNSKGVELSEDEVKHRGAVLQYMRKGTGHEDGSLSVLEAKALAVQSDPDGGYFVTADMSGRTIERIYETSPIRQLSSVVVISTDSLEGTYDTDEAGAEWVGETALPTNDKTPQIGKYTIPVHEMATRPRATQKLLDDSAVNIESWLQGKISRKFARTENSSFINGNGVAKPTGILHYPDATTPEAYEVGKIGTSETAGATVTFDDVLDLLESLKEEYMVMPPSRPIVALGPCCASSRPPMVSISGNQAFRSAIPLPC